jgi:hypothetical protein
MERTNMKQLVILFFLIASLAGCYARNSETTVDPIASACLYRLMQVSGNAPATDEEKAYVAKVCTSQP